jgi:phytoene synthase
MSPEEFVNEKAVRSGSSFYYAFLFLPPQKRAAITAFYAFCREVDDVVDEVSDPGVAQAKLNFWRQQVIGTFDGSLATGNLHPCMQALQPHLKAFGIPREALLGLIEGCAMDLTQTRYLDVPALERYMHLVAGLVGEASAHIFGQTDAQTTPYAHQLGMALQLTNIIRDVGEDARRGRIYLPISELQQFDVKAHEVLNGVYSTRFEALMQHQAERAYGYYDAALRLLPEADRQAQKPGLMMARIYRTLLDEIVEARFAVLHQRIALTPLRKLWLAWKTQFFGA